MRNQFLLIVIIALGLYACGASPAADTGELPDDIASLKNLKKEKEEQIKSLQAELEEIAEKIAEVDPATRKPSQIVTVRSVNRSTFNRFARIQGEVESKNLVQVTTETPGRLVEVRVDEGDNVSRGQLIARIDMESLEKQRQELETSLDLAQEIYVRQKRLWDQNIGSEVQYLQAKNNVEKLEQSIETIDYQMTKANIYAPISGVVDMTNLESGELAQPGVPIVTILDTRNVKVVADLPESYLGKVNRGEKVQVSFPALRDTITAPITLIGRKIDPANRTFKIEIDIQNSGDLYKPNLLAEVLVNDYTLENAIVVSQELIQQEVGGRKYVMTSKKSNGETVARRVYVQTGESYDGNVVVETGLDTTSTLILEGSRGLADGQSIRILNNEYAKNEK